VASPAVLTQPMRGLIAATAQDTGPGAPTSARLMSRLARRTPPAVPVQGPPPRRTIWTVPGVDSTDGGPSLRGSPPHRAGPDLKPIGRVWPRECPGSGANQLRHRCANPREVATIVVGMVRASGGVGVPPARQPSRPAESASLGGGTSPRTEIAFSDVRSRRSTAFRGREGGER
jgi:hypothetical protein